jgi:AraC-like DNA-binding protein
MLRRRARTMNPSACTFSSREYEMTDDRLSQLLDLVDVGGVASGGFAVRGPWMTRGRVHVPLKFIAVVHGRAHLLTDGLDHPVVLQRGDVAILSDRSWLQLSGGIGIAAPQQIEPEEDFSASRLREADADVDDVVFGGRIEIGDTGRALLLDALDPVTHLPAGPDTAPVRDILDRLFAEVTGRRAGSAFAIRQHGQLLMLEVLRAYAGRPDLPPGWFRALSDRRLRAALDLMHDQPDQPWTLAELARAAAMSRTSFAERFRRTVGSPPRAYLTEWRMILARRALEDADVRVGALAAELGYASESAFSTAFARTVGESPRQYRHRVRSV